jgi:hypothetical protein
MTATRVEHDRLGPVNVPADRHWGAQTQRSLEHFSIGDDLIPREMIPAYAIASQALASHKPVHPNDHVNMSQCEHAVLRVGCEGHIRFQDRVENRGHAWKILDRQAIYDMATFTFPTGVVEIDKLTVQKCPREYAPLAYLLEKSGLSVNRVYPTKGRDLEKTIKVKGQTWLKA